MTTTPLRIWLADLTHTQQTIAADVMPFAIACLAEYAEAKLDFLEPIRLFKYPESLAEAFEKDGVPHIMGFSCYIWNAQLAFAFAEVVKKHSPHTVVVFGGPYFPLDEEEQAALFRKWPAIDFFIQKEGETVFTKLVQTLHDYDFDLPAVGALGQPSLFARSEDGTLIAAEAQEKRIQDLDEVPSPYLSQRLDSFFDGKLRPIIKTTRGCPFQCTFCVEGNDFFSKIYRHPLERIRNEIDYIGQKMAAVRAKGGRNDLFIADSNFGMFQQDLDVCHEIARAQEIYNWPEYINVATGKNKKERVLEAASLINGALRLSGSVQSLDPQVMENIKRSNISVDALMDLGGRTVEIGANTYCEIILALPGDSKASHLKTIQSVMDSGFNRIILWQLMLLPGTELATQESKKKFGLKTRYRALPRCHGRYEVLGETVSVGEIEETCVGNAVLSLEEYLECRRFHLVIAIFYNDGYFSTLPKFLKLLGLSSYRWLELIAEIPMEGRLGEIFTSFRQETQNELWDSEEALEAHFQEHGVMESYVRGEKGYNLIQIHTTRAITGPVADMAKVAHTAMARYLQEAGKDDVDILEFVQEAVRFHTWRLQNLFTDLDAEFTASFTYDVQAFEEDSEPRALVDYRQPCARTFRFFLDDEQKETIKRNITAYGNHTMGIGRVITMLHVRKMLRNVVPVDHESKVKDASTQTAL